MGVGECVGGWAGVVGDGVADAAMASLISSSYSLHAFADAFSVSRSCGDSWSIVSLVGVVAGETACPFVGGGGGCVCCGGWGGGGCCGDVDGCGAGGGGGGLVLGVAGVCCVLEDGVVTLVVAVCGGVLCCVLDLLIAGVWSLCSPLVCRWCVGFLGCFGGRVFLVFPFGLLPCGDLRENL